MAPDLILRPAELSAVARVAEALPPVLRPAGLAVPDLDALAVLPGAAVVVAEHDRLLAALGRAEAELAELAAGLRVVAAAAASAELDTVRSVKAVGR
jgi:hypothetical protein